MIGLSHAVLELGSKCGFVRHHIHGRCYSTPGWRLYSAGAEQADIGH